LEKEISQEYGSSNVLHMDSEQPFRNWRVPELIICLIADGRSIHTQRWAEYFAQKGHEVHLITYDPMNHTINGVTEHVILSAWDNLYLAFFPRHFVIRKLVKKINPDLIHAHFITKYGFHLLFQGNYKKIVSAWGDDILILPQSSKILSFFTTRVLKTVDRIYAVSEDIREHIINDFGIPAEIVKYLPFGVDTEKFSPKQNHKKNDEDKVVIFSNRGFLPIYGMDLILIGFSLAYTKNPNIRLILKGEGPEKNRIKQDVIRLGLEKVVNIRDKNSYDQVSDDLREADIFISAAGRDGTPVSLLEAMSTGLPCIATSVGGIPEWIADNINGLLIPPWDYESIAQSIIVLAKDKEKRTLLGNNARAIIIEKGDWKKLMQSASEDYDSISAVGNSLGDTGRKTK